MPACVRRLLPCVLLVLTAAGCQTTLLGDDAGDGNVDFDGGSFDGSGFFDGRTDSPSSVDAGGMLDAQSDLDAGAGTDAAVAVDAGPPPPPCPRARVNTPGEVLNVRPDASTSNAPVGTLPHGYLVEVVAMVRGQNIGGVDLWFQVASPIARGFVLSSFANCTDDEIPEDDGLYYMPFACGASYRVTQSPGGSTSHTGRSAHAFDFGVPLNTPIDASRSGRVTGVRTATGPGDACYGGGGPSCAAATNWVILQHPDGNTSAYYHLNSSTMTVGTEVRRGDVIGASGSTGYSTGPHLHLEVRGNCPTEIFCQTIPFSMADIGVPAAPVTVTSGNCP